MRSTNRILLSAIILLLSDCIASQSMSEEERQCIENPTGAVSLNVDVRGVAGPEGPRGRRGSKGISGEKGNQGLTGKKGDTGLLGEIGPVGSKGLQGEEGVKGGKGSRGIQGLTGPTGGPGLPGPQGVQGEPGDTQLNQEGLDRVSDEVVEKLNTSIMANMLERINKLEQKCMEKPGASSSRTTPYNEPTSSPTPSSSSPLPAISPTPEPGNTLCNITSLNWRRIAYFDTTQGHSCPEGLPTHTNPSTQQTACGKTSGTCSALTYSAGGSYTHVCGKLRGYQYYQPLGVHINQYSGYPAHISTCVDGWTISTGTSGQHLWSYVAGISETQHPIQLRCPCSSSSFNPSWVPPFLQDHYYCESGVVGVASQQHVYWADPLWDGEGCITSGNKCCQRHGWFHRQLDQTSEDIEVNCCDDRFDAGAALLDQLEIWVM